MKNKEQQVSDSDTRIKHVPICSPFNILATLLATLLLRNSTHLHRREKPNDHIHISPTKKKTVTIGTTSIRYQYYSKIKHK